MEESSRYSYDLEIIKSVLIVTSLQKRSDLHSRKLVQDYPKDIDWKPLDELCIDPGAWDYIVIGKGYDPKLIFCHPDVLLYSKATSLYYRGLSGLSQKAAQRYIGTVKSLEEGNPRARFSEEKAVKMSRTYNKVICSVITNTIDWTLEDGYRTIVATLGITIDGKMRNKIGGIAEEHIRTLILDYVIDHNLLIEPQVTKEQIPEYIRRGEFVLVKDIIMRFGSEPDISFEREKDYIAVLEVKGGIDPAGALERYGAATKSFNAAKSQSPNCKNFYLGGVFTAELESRIHMDPFVEKPYNLIEILDDPRIREKFLRELFHYTLRIT